MKDFDITSKIVDKIDSKMENARHHTSEIIEHLIALRTSIDEVMFLETFLNTTKKNFDVNQK